VALTDVNSNAWVLVLLLFGSLFFILTVLVGFGLFMRFGAQALEIEEILVEEGEEERRPPRPWWGNPVVWVGLGLVFLVLGLFVAPHFLGGTFIVLPFFWIGGGRRRYRVRRARRDDVHL
jgi:hypothetical protein